MNLCTFSPQLDPVLLPSSTWECKRQGDHIKVGRAHNPHGRQSSVWTHIFLLPWLLFVCTACSLLHRRALFRRMSAPRYIVSVKSRPEPRLVIYYCHYSSALHKWTMENWVCTHDNQVLCVCGSFIFSKTSRDYTEALIFERLENNFGQKEEKKTTEVWFPPTAEAAVISFKLWKHDCFGELSIDVHSYASSDDCFSYLLRFGY